jgi:hypothetical protein
MVPARAAIAAPKSPVQGWREPGSKETNPRSVPPDVGERVCFARMEPGWQLGQANQTGRVAAGERRSPLGPISNKLVVTVYGLLVLYRTQGSVRI